MGKAKSKNWVLGRWSIDSMSMWDKGYIDAEVPGYFEFGADNLGSFQFGFVQGDLANLLAHAMSRPLIEGDRQRPGIIHLRDRPQWQELSPHLPQLGIQVVLADDLPWFDEAVVDWMQQTKKSLPSVDEIKTTLRKPFPERKRTLFTDTMDLMEWTDAMWKGAYPSRKVADPLYDPTTVVTVQLTADEWQAILTKTEIAKTKKLLPRLEAMTAEGRAAKLEIHEWSRVLLALCGGRTKEGAGRKRLLGMAKRIATHLAEALGIDPPTMEP